jgi:endoglucanase
MRYAVDTLTRNPATAVYIDGGHSRWVSAEDMAGSAQRRGCGQGAGLQPQHRELLHHRREMGLRGTRFRDDRRFALRDRHVAQRRRTHDDTMYWCNPSGRALGAAPTPRPETATSTAFLWVKRPGESDGIVRSRRTLGSTFVSQYAINLASNAGH